MTLTFDGLTGKTYFSSTRSLLVQSVLDITNERSCDTSKYALTYWWTDLCCKKYFKNCFTALYVSCVKTCLGPVRPPLLRDSIVPHQYELIQYINVSFQLVN